MDVKRVSVDRLYEPIYTGNRKNQPAGWPLLY